MTGLLDGLHPHSDEKIFETLQKKVDALYAEISRLERVSATVTISARAAEIECFSRRGSTSLIDLIGSDNSRRLFLIIFDDRNNYLHCCRSKLLTNSLFEPSELIGLNLKDAFHTKQDYNDALRQLYVARNTGYCSNPPAWYKRELVEQESSMRTFTNPKEKHLAIHIIEIRSWRMAPWNLTQPLDRHDFALASDFFSEFHPKDSSAKLRKIG